MKKHQALQAELAGHENRIQTVCDSGQAMINEGHFASDDVAQKILGLEQKWINLKVGLLPGTSNRVANNFVFLEIFYFLMSRSVILFFLVQIPIFFFQIF